MAHGPALYVLIVHSTISVVLILTGAVLIALGDIGQDTLLALVSGALGLISGGGTAVALHNALLAQASPDSRVRHPQPPAQA